jgi:glycosyltransferase involved in cell wall biosynthesis
MSARRISIIIPARNEAAQIRGTVEAALAAIGELRRAETASTTAGRATEAEILVVDNASTDATVSVIADWMERHQVRVLTCRRLGAAAARNVGATHASGDILVFVDADTRVPPESLLRIRGLVEEHGYGAGIFRLAAQRPGLRGACWWRFWNIVRLLPLPRAKALPAFMFCTRRVFVTYGPFDETVAIGEEWPILADLYRAEPRRLVYDRSLTARTSSRRMERQAFGYVRTFVKYVAAVLWPPARVNYTDRIREEMP